MSKFVVLVIDSFGIGAMDDVKEKFKDSINANTLKSLIKNNPNCNFETLAQLGLMNAAGYESKYMKYAPLAIFGKSDLEHYGADSFMGHQEIVCSKAKMPLKEPFQNILPQVKAALLALNHQVEEIEVNDLKLLLVDKYVTIADNIDTAPGMAYNVTAPLDYISFEKEVEIAKVVRAYAKVNRVICFGGSNNNVNDLLNAIEVADKDYLGVVAVKSKSYVANYHCIHMGYGVDVSKQVPALLAKKQVKTYMIGKTADIVANQYGQSESVVETEKVMDKLIECYQEVDEGFIFANVQETDLAGHSEDPDLYESLINLVDKKLKALIEIMADDDILLVMADHGNDPLIGHNQHTREQVPLLISYKKNQKIDIGLRKTMADVGASVLAYFDCEKPSNGQSFLDLIIK